MAKETVGKQVYDLLLKDHNPESPIEYERAMHKEYESEVIKCIDEHKKLFPNDFYVVVLIKRERLMQPVIRNYFFGRLSCPTPQFDQTVYKYHRSEDVLEFLWTVPDKETCHTFKNNSLEIVKEEKELLQMVLDFFDGTLDKKAAFLNDELPIITS